MAETNDNIRPVPNKGLILELAGGNVQFLEQVHHGLCETPTHVLYPHLNLDELLVFEAGSWGFRRDESFDFKKLVDAGELYPIFSKINQEGFPYLQRIQKLDRWENKNDELNPFGRSRTLRQRLERVNPEEVRRLLKGVSQPASTYVFECQYFGVKKAKGGNNFGLEILRFMPVYPKSAEIHAEKYASEIAAILSKYPVQYVPVVNLQPETEPIQPETARQETSPIRIGKRGRKVDTQPRLFRMGWHE